MLIVPQHIEQCLSRINGFHQYSLGGMPRPVYLSQNLCDMLRITTQELDSPDTDRYAERIHPADRAAYAEFLAYLAKEPQSRTLQYRLTRNDGSVIWVSDAMTSYQTEDGMMADSTLTDITELKGENENLRFLSETMPCGFLKYTCGPTPRVTYLNDRMKQLLGIPEGGPMELYTQSIYLFIPVEERQRFAAYLDRVSQHSAPLAGELTILRCDGTRARLFGWVTKCVNERGEEEFQSACMDVTERHNLKKEQQTQRYLKALTEVYDRIYEYDLSARTVKCLHAQNVPGFRWIANLPMQMEEATRKWICENVVREDIEEVRSYFRAFWERREQPPVIRYRTLSEEGRVEDHTGLFLQLAPSVSLFCCRDQARDPEADTLRSENDTLKSMQQLVMRFTEGIVAFEVENDTVKPLYTSDNVCSFFGYSREQWLALAEHPQSIREFISQSGIAYEDVQRLFASGEAEFTYFDMKQNAYRRIRAICSRKVTDGTAKTYVMLYNMVPQPEPAEPEKRVRIRTFGYFDVFVDGKPIAFRNEKSKELFALLVDRRGGFVSSEEAIGFLWEDEPADTVTLARYRKVALRLKNLLEEYGIADVVESVSGKRRIAAEKVQCDLYDYLSGKDEYAQLFKGSYLTNYSWGETTLAELTGELIGT